MCTRENSVLWIGQGDFRAREDHGRRIMGGGLGKTTGGEVGRKLGGSIGCGALGKALGKVHSELRVTVPVV